MGRYGLGTRVAMIVLGATWLIVGGSWLIRIVLARLASGEPRDSVDQSLDAAVFVVVIAGVMLVKTGLTPDPAKTFEDELPDTRSDLDDSCD